MKNEAMLTYQTRLILDDGQREILDQCAYFLSKVERCLYAEIAKSTPAAACKNHFLKKFNITARQFNACRVSIEGKIEACKASQQNHVLTLKGQIQALDKKIKVLEKQPSKAFMLHQKKRRFSILNHRLESVQKDLKENRVRLCFGGKRLFRAQFFLEQNGFASYLDWKSAWEKSRSSEFFTLGSKDEASGNQTCTAKIEANGQLSLRLRLPKNLEEKYGKYLFLKNVDFKYGQEAIQKALNHPGGQAISYRFKKDEKSWRIFASTNLEKVEVHSVESHGVIGIDLNADHIAYAETDRFGNLVAKKVFSWISYGKSKGELKAITGDICKRIVEYAKTAKKPIILEKLDFQKKKNSLKNENRKFARLLSSFSYNLFFKFLRSRAFKNGIQVHQVNPAYTSIIGRVKYAKRYGLSIHLAAAFCIARRYQQFSDPSCSSPKDIPDGKGGHVAFILPVRNRMKHVWHFWEQVKKKIKTVLAAHYLAIKNRSLSSFKPAFETGNPDNYW